MAKKLKLFVWEKVLENYKHGIMFAYAKDVKQARELVEKSLGFHHPDIDKEPREVTDAEGFHIVGSA